MSARETISGPLPARLGNAISDAIHDALKAGMEPDEASCVAVRVAADYARCAYGPAYLNKLAEVIVECGQMPPPMDISEGGA